MEAPMKIWLRNYGDFVVFLGSLAFLLFVAMR
jgi:hypothetical protein